MKNRKEMLADIINQYVDDPEYSARRIYEEMLSVLISEVIGRDESAEKAFRLKELVLGYNIEETFEKGF